MPVPFDLKHLQRCGVVIKAPQPPPPTNAHACVWWKRFAAWFLFDSLCFGSLGNSEIFFVEAEQLWTEVTKSFQTDEHTKKQTISASKRGIQTFTMNSPNWLKTTFSLNAILRSTCYVDVCVFAKTSACQTEQMKMWLIKTFIYLKVVILSENLVKSVADSLHENLTWKKKNILCKKCFCISI